MEQLTKVFSFGNTQIRTVVLEDEPWFVAKDIAELLEFSETAAMTRYLDAEEKTNLLIKQDGSNLTTNVTIISESGLYSAIFRSRKPEAREFKRWITHEVIPTIRKHGAYVTPTKLEEIIRDPDVMIQLLTELKREQQERARLQLETVRQAEVIEEQAERLTYLDEILLSKDTLNITQIAADYGMTARKLNQILKEAGIQRRTGGQWILCAKHHRQGLTKSVTHPITLGNGGTKTVMHTRWTQAGRLLIHQTLTKLGVKANQDIGIDSGMLVVRPQAKDVRKQPATITLNLRIDA